MNIKEIKEMINLMNENNLSELEVEKDGMKVRLKRQGKEQDSAQQPARIIVEKEKVAQVEEQKAAIQGAAEKLLQIKSPMVGTFYKAPSPESPPFVDIGDEIEVGQIVCIVEAMKLMNEIKSDIKGKIKEIFVESGQAVEFGQLMFVLEPA